MSIFKDAGMGFMTGGLSLLNKDKIGGITDKVGLTDTGATDRALQAQKESAAESNRILEQMYGESEDRFSPYREGGLKSFQDLMAMGEGFDGFEMGNIEEDPGYDFRMQEGVKALDRSAASRGRLQSGATGKAIQKYGQDLGSQEYGKAYGRNRQQIMDKSNLLNQIAQYGQNANVALSGQGQTMAGKIGDTATSLGSARAAGEMGRGNQMKDLWKMGIQGVGMAA